MILLISQYLPRPARFDPHQRGNVLFLLLILVIVFAALSYSVVASERSGNVKTSDEQIALATSQFQQYKSYLLSAYTRLSMNPCAPEEVFLTRHDGSDYLVYLNGTPGGTLNTYGTTAIANSSCDLFSVNGGGVPLPYNIINAGTGLAQYFGREEWRFKPIKIYDNANFTGSSANDLTAYIELSGNNNIGVKICEKINWDQGIPSSTSDTYPTMKAEIAPIIANRISLQSLSSDFFCDGDGIRIVLDSK